MKKNLFNISTLCVLVLISLFLTTSFDMVRNNKYILETSYLYKYSYDVSRFVAQKVLEIRSEDALEYNVYLPEIGDSRYLNDYIKNNFTSSSNYIDSLRNMYYEITDLETGKVISNHKFDNEYNTYADQFAEYYVYEFNRLGMISTIAGSDRFGSDLFLISTSSQYLTDPNTGDEQEYYYRDPVNIKVQIAIPYEMSATDAISNYVAYDYYGMAMSALTPYIFISFAFIALFILIIPFKKIKNLPIFKQMAELPFEVLSISWIVCAFFLLVLGSGVIQEIYLSNYSTGSSAMFKNFLSNSILSYSSIFGYWFICLSFVAFLAFMVKYLFDKGFTRYVTENTVIFTMLKSLSQLSKNVSKTDIESSAKLTVFKVVLANCAVVIVLLIINSIAFNLFYGIEPFIITFLSLAAYSFIIYKLVKDRFVEIQDDYKTLLTATREVSKGNFRHEITEDIGVFNPLKQEFSHIKDGFENAINEEVKSQNMKTELITNVSHDLKTPLTSIISYINLLKEESISDEDKQKFIKVLDNNALRLKHLIDDLFDISKVNSGNVQLNLYDVDITSLIKQSQLECEDDLSHKNLNIIFKEPEEKIICHLDSTKTYRIFENLFVNMSRYAMSNTRAYIDIYTKDQQVVIEFKNISENEMNFNEDIIVERFVQGDESRHSVGSGLGLAIVKSFVEIQGGTFKVRCDGDLFKAILTFPIV